MNYPQYLRVPLRRSQPVTPHYSASWCPRRASSDNGPVTRSTRWEGVKLQNS